MTIDDHRHEVDAAVVGMAFSFDITGNRDFGVSMAITVACVTLALAALMPARLAFVRWTLVAVASIVVTYYLVGLVMVAVGAISREVSALAIVTAMLWATALLSALLPATGRAMRRH